MIITSNLEMPRERVSDGAPGGDNLPHLRALRRGIHIIQGTFPDRTHQSPVVIARP